MSQSQLPLTKVAFDDAETRSAWEETRRLVSRRLKLWGVLLVVGLIAGCVLSGFTATAVEPLRRVGPLVFVLTLFGYIVPLCFCRGALSLLKQARRVLEVHPWQRLPAVRKVTGARKSTGVVVQFQPPAGTESSALADDCDAWHSEEDGTWSQTMSVRNPLRWNRWDEVLEQGAWFAGVFELGGVLALPGGRGLMTVQRRNAALISDGQGAGRNELIILAAAAQQA